MDKISAHTAKGLCRSQKFDASLALALILSSKVTDVFVFFERDVCRSAALEAACGGALFDADALSK
jgi:hypothetical protein